MNIKISTPPFFIDAIIVCIDDENPPANAENWIEKGKMYKLKGATPAENCDELSYIITDNAGKIIKPSKEISGFKASRFKFAFELCKN